MLTIFLGVGVLHVTMSGTLEYYRCTKDIGRKQAGSQVAWNSV